MNFPVGQLVRLREEYGTQRVQTVGGYGGYDGFVVEHGDTVEVTRTGAHKFIGRKSGRSGWLEAVMFEPVETTVTGGGRRPGDVPEGMLSPHDPRLEWFWDDVSDVIQRSNYCSQVDSVLAMVQAPPRKRKFEARGEIAGIVIRSEVMARTQEEANAKLVAALLAAREVEA